MQLNFVAQDGGSCFAHEFHHEVEVVDCRQGVGSEFVCLKEVVQVRQSEMLTRPTCTPLFNEREVIRVLRFFDFDSPLLRQQHAMARRARRIGAVKRVDAERNA